MPFCIKVQVIEYQCDTSIPEGLKKYFGETIFVPLDEFNDKKIGKDKISMDVMIFVVK